MNQGVKNITSVRNLDNCIRVSTINPVKMDASSSVFVPSALLSNIMSLPPKFDEVREVITDANYDLAFLTETWLHDQQSSNAFAISGYNFFRQDRSKDLHGGVCLYIMDSIKYEVIDDLFDERLEAIWMKIRPPRLPRGMSSIVISTIYHPQTDKGVFRHRDA